MSHTNTMPTHILVVDDNERVREGLRMRLAMTSTGYRVEACASGAEALEKLDAIDFDIVLCDLTLHGDMDGIEVTRAVRERHPQTKVVIFTGIARGERKLQALEAGAFAYLSKPILYDELALTIESVNSIRRTERLQARFEMLARFSIELQTTFDREHLVEQILGGARSLGYARARLYLVDSETLALVGHRSSGMDPDFALADYHIPLAESALFEDLFASDRPRLRTWSATTEAFGEDEVGSWTRDLGLESTTWIDCPLLARSRRIGVLAVDHHGSLESSFTDDDLKVLGLFCTLAAQSLENSRLYQSQALANASLRSVIRDAPDVLMTTDLVGTINNVSPSSERVLGYSTDELLGRRAMELYTDANTSPQAGEQIAAGLMEELLAAGTLSNRKVLVRRQGGGSQPISISLSLLHDDHGEAVGTLGILKDLGPLEEQTRQYRELLEGFGYGTLMLDGRGAVVFLNRKAQGLLGRPDDQLLGHAFDTFIPAKAAAELQAGRRHVIHRRTEVTLDLPLLQPDGSRVLVTAKLTPVLGDESPDAVGVALYDKRELGTLAHSGRLMALGQMVAGVGHEINNPTNHILLAAGELERILHNTQDPLTAEYVSMIMRNGRRIRDIVAQLRQFGRQSDFEPRPESLNALVERALALVTTRLRNDNVELELALTADLPPALVDARRIEQVLINLLVNAEQAMDGQETPKRLTISTELIAADRLAVAVSDTGPGVPDSILESIFDPFFTTKATKTGTGLGLAISKNILELHQGSILVTKAQGGYGASFRIELPAAVSDMEASLREDPGV